MATNNAADKKPATEEDRFFVFAEEEAPAIQTAEARRPWKIMVVDDDDEVHVVSRMVLKDFVFEGRPLNLISAHSGAAARQLIAEHPDTAMIILDVVMETERAGLDAVHYIRDVLKNRFVRIVLRTGQPGQAPESSVVIDYDINDYKEKTELTVQKLVTAVVSGLRSYRDLQTIEASRQGLEQIIHASRNLFEPQSLVQFSSGVLVHLSSLLHLGEDNMLLQPSGFTAKGFDTSQHGEFVVIAGHGRYADCVGQRVEDKVAPEILARLRDVRTTGKTHIDSDCFIGHFRASTGFENLVYLQTGRPIAEMDAQLLHVFSMNVGIAFDNVYLNEELMETQTEIIQTLSEVVETRSQETGQHVRRVGEYSRLLGELLGMEQRECDMLRMVAPMHDIGKIGIPDVLLNKPGRHSDEEFEAMKTHAALGHHIFGSSHRAPLRAAAIIAHQHHERWDGKGYPGGLHGEEIHIYGRIVAIADVFDALCHRRCYKPAWPLEQVFDYISQNSGKHFDPALAELFLNHRERFVAILEAYPDA